MTTEEATNNAIKEFGQVLAHLKEEFARLQIGRANPSLIENVPVAMYGVSQPIKAIASITIPDPRTIMIQPWDRNALSEIEKGIVGVGLGLNPVNDGVVVRISIPPLTEERRAELTKHLRKLAEEAKIAIRNARQDAHIVFKQLRAGSDITEDDFYAVDKKLQAKVADFNTQIDSLADAKEKDVMTI